MKNYNNSMGERKPSRLERWTEFLRQTSVNCGKGSIILGGIAIILGGYVDWKNKKNSHKNN